MGLLHKIWDKTTDVLHEVTGIPTASEKRTATQQMNDQIKAYKDQTEITRQETERKQGETQAAKRQVEQKQIRALRGTYRSQGLMNAATSQNDMSNKLGG